MRPLFEVLPRLSSEVSWAELGDFPTPVRALPESLGPESRRGYVKCDDVSSPIYGGNKVRTLEALFGHAQRVGARTVVAVGAFGSNHSVATALHAPRVGLESAAILFPQRYSWAALENFVVSASALDELWALPHWAWVPWAMWRYPRRAGQRRVYVMPPGGANPLGVLGYVSAAFELAEQVERGELPAPECIVVGVGSTCTSAGLLLGLALAARQGLGFRAGSPRVLSIRVTPWPVTSRFRIVGLAHRTSRLVAKLCGDPSLVVERSELGRHLGVSGSQLGKGYGIPTAAALKTMERWSAAGLPALDTTYSSKAATGFLQRCARSRGPVLFWSTKSSVPLPAVDPKRLRSAPARALRWIRDAERALASELPPSYVRLDAIKSE